MKTYKCLMLLGASFGFLSVLFGAFGAHALKAKLSHEMLNIFEIGVRYQMFHAIVLLLVGWMLVSFSENTLVLSGWFFVAGILIFSGSLYVLALSGVKLWGAVTPIGGLFLLVGWIILILAILRIKY